MEELENLPLKLCYLSNTRNYYDFKWIW